MLSSYAMLKEGALAELDMTSLPMAAALRVPTKGGIRSSGHLQAAWKFFMH
jgi:hypothetical protein